MPLIRITAPHFVAGLVAVVAGKVIAGCADHPATWSAGTAPRWRATADPKVGHGNEWRGLMPQVIYEERPTGDQGPPRPDL